MTTKRRSYEAGHTPKFLVVVDDTPECDRAIYYASRRCARIGAKVLMCRVIQTQDRNQQWLGVADIMRAIVRECVAVGRAEGAMLDDSIAESVVSGYRAAPPDSVNSLHADRVAGRPLETDARNGVIVRLGRKHGIATPLNQMIVALLEAARLP